MCIVTSGGDHYRHICTIMSDIHKLRQKVTQGKEWRGTIRVMLGEDEAELTVRQLKDEEFFEVMSMIDKEELESLRGDLPDDELERYYDLQDKEDELTDEEQEEFAELEELLNQKSANLFQTLSKQTFDGIILCAKYSVEPDDSDLKSAMMDDEWVHQKEEEGYGPIKTPEDCYEPLKDDIGHMLEDATDFTSFNIGLMTLIETVGDSKN